MLTMATLTTAWLTMPHTLTRYSGFCELGIELQRCENAALRACAGLAAAQTGLMVKSVHPMCPLPKDALRKGDVLTHFDGVKIQFSKHPILGHSINFLGKSQEEN